MKRLGAQATQQPPEGEQALFCSGALVSDDGVDELQEGEFELLEGHIHEFIDDDTMHGGGGDGLEECETVHC